MADPSKAVDDQTQLLSDLSLQWAGVRDIVESFANRYYLQEPLERGTAQEMVQAGLELTSKLAAMWLKSVAITTKQGARMVAEAFESVRHDQNPPPP